MSRVLASIARLRKRVRGLVVNCLQFLDPGPTRSFFCCGVHVTPPLLSSPGTTIASSITPIAIARLDHPLMRYARSWQDQTGHNARKSEEDHLTLPFC